MANRHMEKPISFSRPESRNNDARRRRPARSAMSLAGVESMMVDSLARYWPGFAPPLTMLGKLTDPVDKDAISGLKCSDEPRAEGSRPRPPVEN